MSDKIKKYNVKCWLVNTGWASASYPYGYRIKIKYTRKMLSAAINGQLKNEKFEIHPIFELEMPKSIKSIPNDLLNPRNVWKNKKDYDEKSYYLAKLFRINFKKFAINIDKEILLS